MRKVLKALAYGVVGLAVLIGGLLAYVMTALPKVKPAEDLKVEITPARVERGRYLVHHVADCYSCHSLREWDKFAAPVKAGTEFAGGEPIFDQRVGLPGVVPPKNISPYNLKHYTDGELVRVLRTGVRRNGEPLFPMMPYQNYAEMAQEDLYSVIAYLRSGVKEVKSEIPEHKLDPPLNVIVRLIPKDAGDYKPAPDRKDGVAYGRYLVKMASCSECHTPVNDKHEPLMDEYMSGGQEWSYLDFDKGLAKMPTGKLRTANLTPDPETGIGSWTKEQFLGRFREWRGAKGQAKVARIKTGDFQTIMPWLFYSGMSDQDLGAIYDYLRSLKPVRKKVEKFTPPEL